MVERRTPEREVGVRSSLRSSCCVLEQNTFPTKGTGNTQEAVASPDMTEKLFTGTLSKNQTKRFSRIMHVDYLSSFWSFHFLSHLGSPVLYVFAMYLRPVIVWVWDEPLHHETS